MPSESAPLVADGFAILDAAAKEDPVMRALRRWTAATVLYGAMCVYGNDFLCDVAKGLQDSLAADLEEVQRGRK